MLFRLPIVLRTCCKLLKFYARFCYGVVNHIRKVLWTFRPYIKLARLGWNMGWLTRASATLTYEYEFYGRRFNPHAGNVKPHSCPVALILLFTLTVRHFAFRLRAWVVLKFMDKGEGPGNGHCNLILSSCWILNLFSLLAFYCHACPPPKRDPCLFDCQVVERLVIPGFLTSGQWSLCTWLLVKIWPSEAHSTSTASW